MFRNLRLYRVNSPWPEAEQQLSALLEKCSFVPCGPLTEKRSGWEKPVDHELAGYCRRVNGADLLQLRTQSRLLPVAAIQEALVERVDEFRSRMGEEPSRRALRRLKEETRDELLPKALLRSERINGFFLIKDKLLGIDAASDSKAERFLDLLRASLQNLEFTPLSFSDSPGELLNALFMGDNRKGFALGNECRMQDLSEQKSVATWRHTVLSDSTIRQHVIDGMKLTHLQVEYDDLMSFVMADNGTISKIRFPEGDAADVSDEEDPVALLDANFVLLTGTVRKLIGDLKKLLGGYASTQDQQADAA